MNTLFGVGEEVYIKGVVKRINVYSDSKGKVTVEYCIDFPSMLSAIGYGGGFKEDKVYRIPDEK